MDINKIDKYLDEGGTLDEALNVQDMRIKNGIKNLDSGLYDRMRTSYYGVGDHITNLVSALTAAKIKDKAFAPELKAAQSALHSFYKLSVGKIL